MNKISSKDANFNDLKTAVNSSATLEVSTAKSADMGKYGQVEFFFTSKEQVAAERAATGAISDSEPIDQLFLGKTSGKEETESGNTQVVLSDGTGKAATAPEVEQAATAAHEIYGHGLPNMQGLPWKHDRGPVDANVIRIEDRTRQLYDKNP